jgi:RNA polymerase sigma-70 factor (ECF subfamily)
MVTVDASRHDFTQSVEPFRRELLAHCYRMTGSLHDAEDALQNGLVRAWKSLATFERRASLRTWLYRVTTNSCIDVLAERRNRSMPHEVAPSGSADEPGAHDSEPRWIEPFPDALLDDGPEAVYSRRESIRLAFVVALHALPARQRAVLVLRDVVAMSAEETAEALELTVPACNSLLQRARATLEQQPRRPPAATTSEHADLLARYVHAWESGDARGLIAILRHDAISSMPPNVLWLAGAELIAEYMTKFVWAGGPIRLVATAASGAPAFGVYQLRDGVRAFSGLSIVELDAGAITAIHTFLAVDPARYSLPRSLAV